MCLPRLRFVEYIMVRAPTNSFLLILRNHARPQRTISGSLSIILVWLFRLLVKCEWECKVLLLTIIRHLEYNIYLAQAPEKALTPSTFIISTDTDVNMKNFRHVDKSNINIKGQTFNRDEPSKFSLYKYRGKLMSLCKLQLRNLARSALAFHFIKLYNCMPYLPKHVLRVLPVRSVYEIICCYILH